MMVFLSGTGWTIFCLLMLGKRTVGGERLQCSVSPVGERHPVQGLLERFEAGPGCAARERGDKETHVIAVGRATHSPDDQVTVVLKPLSLSLSPRRALVLVLSSQLPIRWWLEVERLAPDLPVLVQLSSNSTVQSYALPLRVQPRHSLPFRPHTLVHWAKRHHGGLSSLTHTAQANRVYIRVGEDSTLPAVCQLQSLFLSHNYLTSDLQPQEVQGCNPKVVGGDDLEVHVIKLYSAGSGLCGSLQVEVIVSLVPPVVNSRTHKVVLILSSAVPVNWALTAHGLRGHVSVHSSNSVSPTYPAYPYLTLSSMLNSDLSTTPDLLAWANNNGFPEVTSYTEADLANRFVIRLAGGGTEVAPAVRPVVADRPWAEERRLREWLGGEGRAGGGQESVAVQCGDGRLSVAVDRHFLQTLSAPVAAVTLRDPKCQAQSNGSHFLFAYPVISCGTEGLLLRQPRGVQYKNMVLIWRHKPETAVAHNDTDRRTGPLGIHFSCLAAVPSLHATPDDVPTPPPSALAPWGPQDPGPDRDFVPTPRPRRGPFLILKLFVTESYEKMGTGPCVIIADQRVYVEVSTKGPVTGGVEVRSCVVSPLSDPRKPSSWTLIKDGCSTDPSLTLSKVRKGVKRVDDDDDDGDDDVELEEEEREKGGRGNEEGHKDAARGASFRRNGRAWRRDSSGGATRDRGGMRGGREEGRGRTGPEEEEEEIHFLRFSFVLRPVYNDSIQFVQCSLQLCVSGSAGQSNTKAATGSDCQSGLSVPRLVSTSPSQQCEIRNLSRPVVVTQPIGSAASKPLRPPVGQRTTRASVSQLANPSQEHSSSLVETGPVMGIAFAAFVMGVSLMRALWCIYTYTGTQPQPIRRGSLLAISEQSNGSHGDWNSPAVMDQSNSSV
ncbi:transforming growth factor beta receptor type 3 [Polymixia lowei]